MQIDPDKCLGCGSCVDYCPMACILEGADGYYIDQDECVECGVCLRAAVCPVEAIYMPESSKEYPRYLRAAFSDPGVQFPETFQGGRGTEEMKTNDVTGKFRRGQFGMTLEFGRPGTGARFKEVEKIALALADLDVHLEEANPLVFLMEDKKTGRMKPEVREEKVLSCILEFGFRDELLEDVVQAVKKALEEVETVVSWGLVTRFDPDGSLPCRERLEKIGVMVRPNAKINMGLGRPLIDE